MIYIIIAIVNGDMCPLHFVHDYLKTITFIHILFYILLTYHPLMLFVVTFLLTCFDFLGSQLHHIIRSLPEILFACHIVDVQ